MPEPSKGIGAADFGTKMAGGVNYLLAIAIDEYEHLPKLYNCRRDAEEFIRVLTENYPFEPYHVTKIFDPQARAPAIHAAFRNLIQIVRPADNLVIYFSGHGEYDPLTDEGYWIPVDAGKEAYFQYITNDSIRRYIGRINSLHTFLISDSCFAGSLFAKGAFKNISKRYEHDPSRWGLSAGRNEIVSDGKPGMHSPFADALLYRLKQNEDALGVQELCAYVVEQVQAHANQSPVGEPLRVEGHKNGQFVFRKKIQIPAKQNSIYQEETTRLVVKTSDTVSGAQDIAISKMIFVKGGTFTMGWLEGRDGEIIKEAIPSREVTVGDFFIGEHPVSNIEFSAFINENQDLAKWFMSRPGPLFQQNESGNIEPRPNVENKPVSLISWHDAKAYCRWLGEKNSKKYRLPTEAEWEFAARGGVMGLIDNFKYSGSNSIDEVGWFAGPQIYGPVHVKKLAPNQLGIYDMSGNVWEWVEDWWHENYEMAPTNGEAWREENNGHPSFRVARGGSAVVNANSCRVAARAMGQIASRMNMVFGFRVVQD